MGYRSSLLKIEMSRTCQALKVSKWRLKFQPERKQNNVIFKRKFSLDFQWILGDVESSVAANFCINPLLPLSLALVLFRYNNQSGPQLLCGSALHLAPKRLRRNNIGEPKRKVIVKGTVVPRLTCLCLPKASGLGTPTSIFISQILISKLWNCYISKKKILFVYND